MGNKKKLIENNCANLINGECIYFGLCYCIELDKIRKKDKHCKYYLDSILPLDEELQNKELTEVKEGYRKRCEKCNCTFISRSRNKKYCNKCKALKDKENNRKRQSKHRNKRGK